LVRFTTTYYPNQPRPGRTRSLVDRTETGPERRYEGSPVGPGGLQMPPWSEAVAAQRIVGTPGGWYVRARSEGELELLRRELAWQVLKVSPV